MGINGIGKSLLDLAPQKKSMLDWNPTNSKSIDLFGSGHESKPCMESFSNGEALFMTLEVRRNDEKGSPLLVIGGLLLGETLNKTRGSIQLDSSYSSFEEGN